MKAGGGDGGGEKVGTGYGQLRRAYATGRGLPITADRFWSIFSGWAEDESGKWSQRSPAFSIFQPNPVE